MAYPTKIVTCCYCGARAALVMAKQGRHELACSRCAAPLHDLKMLPVAKVPSKKVEGELIRSHRVGTAKKNEPRKSKKSYEKRKKSKHRFKFLKDMFEDVFEDAFEFIEDIFD